LVYSYGKTSIFVSNLFYFILSFQSVSCEDNHFIFLLMFYREQQPWKNNKAYLFKGMSTISGFIYDFHIKNKNLYEIYQIKMI